MGLSDKINSKSNELIGAAKEKIGDLTDNDDLKGKGADQKVEDVKDKATDLKHGAQSVTDKLKN